MMGLISRRIQLVLLWEESRDGGCVVDWLVGDDGGQKVISDFAISSLRLQTKSPRSLRN